MMSSAVIRSLSREQASKARKARKEPLPIELEDLEDCRQQIVTGSICPIIRQIPNLGDYRPKGWTLGDHKLVDKSGFGDESEPALTLRGLLAWMSIGHAYAIIEEGQFQVVIGEFTKGKTK